MNCQTLNDSLLDLVEGELPPPQSAEAMTHLDSCPECKQAYRAFLSTWNALDQLPKPSPKLSARFEGALDAYQKGEAEGHALRHPPQEEKVLSFPKSLRRSLPVAVAASLAFVLGLSIDKLSQDDVFENDPRLAAIESDIADLKEATALSLLAQNSPSDRLQGAEQLAQFSANDPEIVNTLYERTQSDPNINVRFAALRTLDSFGSQTFVSDKLLQILDHPNSPLIQAEVIKALVRREESRAIPKLIEISQNPSENQTVRELSRWGVASIQSTFDERI